MEEYFNQHEHIDSVKYREKINQIVKNFKLKEKTGIINFCICIIFRNGKKYFLSNMPDWAIKYHKMGGSRSDEVFDLALMKNKNYFIPRQSVYDTVQDILVRKEENKFKYFDVYSLIRRCVDCTFILLAVSKFPQKFPEKIYYETRDQFEEFSIFFIKNMLSEIKIKNKNFLIFNKNDLLEKVIKKGVIKDIPALTERELECIHLLKNNYPPKLIASSIGIQEKTVRNYIKSIQEKMNCNSMLDILKKSIQYDL